MQINRVFSIAAALCVGISSIAGAQRTSSRPIEFGIDAGVSFGLDDPKVTSVSIPIQAFRVGFFISDNVSLEPRLALTSYHTSGESLTSYDGELGVLWHLTGTRNTSRLFVRPFTGFTGISGFGDSDTQAELGAGVGVKLPFSNRVAGRVEGIYRHYFESGDSYSGNEIGLQFGLSFFTR